jgi:transcriptional regulator GlxA family with amidase domain
MRNTTSPSTSHPLRHIALLAFDDCQSLDVCGPLEVFAFADRWLYTTGRIAQPAYALSVLAEEPGPVVSMSGLRVHADRAIRDIDGGIDTLLVSGGMVEGARKNPALLGFLHRMAGQVRRLGSICTGAFLLAEAGLLDGRRVTTHWAYCAQFAGEYPKVRLEPDLISIRDGNIYSSGGITAGIDLALALVEEDWGAEVAAMVGRWILVFPNRPGGQSQFSVNLHQGASARTDFCELQDWIMSHPHENLDVEALAERMSMSPRHFSRTFAREVGLTPAKFVELARLERARLRLEQTLLPVETIAAQSGFGTPEHMRRAFQRAFKVSPQDYRARFRSPRQAASDGHAWISEPPAMQSMNLI